MTEDHRSNSGAHEPTQLINLKTWETTQIGSSEIGEVNNEPIFIIYDPTKEASERQAIIQALKDSADTIETGEVRGKPLTQEVSTNTRSISDPDDAIRAFADIDKNPDTLGAPFTVVYRDKYADKSIGVIDRLINNPQAKEIPVDPSRINIFAPDQNELYIRQQLEDSGFTRDQIDEMTIAAGIDAIKDSRKGFAKTRSMNTLPIKPRDNND